MRLNGYVFWAWHSNNRRPLESLFIIFVVTLGIAVLILVQSLWLGVNDIVGDFTGDELMVFPGTEERSFVIDGVFSPYIPIPDEEEEISNLTLADVFNLRNALKGEALVYTCRYTGEVIGDSSPYYSFISLTPDYFTAMGLEAEKGRLFTHDDIIDDVKVVVLGADLAALYFPGEDPLGKVFTEACSIEGYEIIGILKAPKNPNKIMAEPFMAREVNRSVYLPQRKGHMAPRPGYFNPSHQTPINITLEETYIESIQVKPLDKETKTNYLKRRIEEFLSRQLPSLYLLFNTKAISLGLGITLSAIFLFAIYPALLAIRINPADTLRTASGGK